MASKFVRPRHKDEVLGAATESVRRARTAAAKDFTTMRENFVNTRTWRYYQEAERGADEPVVVSTPCDGAVVDAGERREVGATVLQGLYASAAVAAAPNICHAPASS